MKFILKAVKKRVVRPGSRGGIYWIDKKGNVRYDVAFRKNPCMTDMAVEMFRDNLKYYIGMAVNIGRKYGITEIIDTQPTGKLADLISAGRLAAIKAFHSYHKNKYKNIDLKGYINRQVANSMYRMADKISNLVNISNTGKRHYFKISRYRDQYFAKHGYYPDINNIVANVKLIDYNTGKDYKPEKKEQVIRDILDYSRMKNSAGDYLDIEELPGEKIDSHTLPSADKLMEDIGRLRKQNKLSGIEYKIIKMYLGYRAEKPLERPEIAKVLKLDRRRVYEHFAHAASVLKPEFEKYRTLLEKSISKDRLREFIKLVLEIE